MRLSIPDQHQKRIAISTLRMTDAGASIMGGMSKAEAREFLTRIGCEDQIAAIENFAQWNKQTQCVYCGEEKHTVIGDTCPQFDKENNR